MQGPASGRVLLAFDDVVYGTSAVYSSSMHHAALGAMEACSLEAVVDPVPGTTVSTTTVQLETSADGRHWTPKNLVAEIDAASTTEGATRTPVGTDLDMRPGGGLARLRVQLGGGPETPVAHVRVYVRPGRDPGIVPARFPNCELWLRADLGIELTAGTPTVASWRDMSLAGRSASQSTATRRPAYNTSPINGMPSLYFDASSGGAERYMSLAGSFSGLSAVHAFLVARNVSAAPPSAARSGLWRLGGSGSPSNFPATDGLLYDDVGSSARYNQGAAPATLTSPFCYEVRATSSGWQSFINGGAQSSSGTNTVAWSGTLELGANTASGVFYDGHVAELILYGRVLATAERTALVAYLNARYALGMS